MYAHARSADLVQDNYDYIRTLCKKSSIPPTVSLNNSKATSWHWQQGRTQDLVQGVFKQLRAKNLSGHAHFLATPPN
jgi:hypothetical protein